MHADNMSMTSTTSRRSGVLGKMDDFTDGLQKASGVEKVNAILARMKSWNDSIVNS